MRVCVLTDVCHKVKSVGHFKVTGVIQRSQSKHLKYLGWCSQRTNFPTIQPFSTVASSAFLWFPEETFYSHATPSQAIIINHSNDYGVMIWGD